MSNTEHKRVAGPIGIVGATGAVGRKMVEVLAERGFAPSSFRLFASSRSRGRVLTVGTTKITVEELTEEAIREPFSYLLFSAGSSVSRRFAPIAAEAGNTVIDNSSAWRMDNHIPLVVPSVNGEVLRGYKGIVANPNCSTIQMVIPLKAIHALFGLKKVVVATYQAVSGSGQKGIQELKRQLSDSRDPQVFSRPIAFNCVPHIDVFTESGYSKEELKMVNETRKILGVPELAVEATTVRVPVWNGHSEAVYVETEEPVDLAKLLGVWEKEENLQVYPQQADFPTVLDVDDKDEVLVGRIRKSLHNPRALNFWVVADNLRRGAATNAVEIMEKLIELQAGKAN